MTNNALDKLRRVLVSGSISSVEDGVDQLVERLHALTVEVWQLREATHRNIEALECAARRLRETEFVNTLKLVEQALNQSRKSIQAKGTPCNIS